MKALFRAWIVMTLLAGPWLRAQDGLAGALQNRFAFAGCSPMVQFACNSIAAADFDGDNSPDAAILMDARPANGLRTIEIHLTARRNTRLTFVSPESSILVTAIDVNRDGAADIVVEQPLTHKRLELWLNDGRGAFHSVPAERFPSPASDSNSRAGVPSARGPYGAACLAVQRGTESAIAAYRFLLRSHSPAVPDAPALSFIAVQPSSAPALPRAPPLD
ncbi:MAG: VCBS repeat-containing protein [Acidobacteria bacterium]|nr:VCBS repeat-containing protein [Acidobacteriota bacterium]